MYKGLGAHTVGITNHLFQPSVDVQSGSHEFPAMLQQ